MSGYHEIEFWTVAHLNAVEMDFLGRLMREQHDGAEPGSDLSRLAHGLLVKLASARGEDGA